MIRHLLVPLAVGVLMAAWAVHAVRDGHRRRSRERARNRDHAARLLPFTPTPGPHPEEQS